MVLKLLGLGLRGFILDNFNIFDAIIVLMSSLEIALMLANVETPALTSLRAFRALRMLKLVRYNSGMRKMLHQMKNSLKAICSFSAVLMLFLFVFSLMGMEMFAYKVIMDETGQFTTPSQAQKLVSLGSEN